MLVWQFLIVSKRHRGTAGDEKGGVWPYSTESNSTPDTGYSLAQQQLFHFGYLVLCSFLKTVWRVQIFLLRHRKVLYLTMCVCQKPTAVDPTKPRQQSTNTNNEYLGLSLFLLEHNKNKSFHYFNYSPSSTSLSKHTLSF